MAKQQEFTGGLRQSMSWVHTWVGLVLSLILYFMFITGSAGYFNTEIDQWMTPELPVNTDAKSASSTQMVQHAVNRLSALPSAKSWWIDLPSERNPRQISIYAEPISGETEVDEKLHPLTGEVLPEVRNTGGGRALYVMHYALHYIPYEVAIYIVGAATLFMFAALITGIVIHKKIFADFFTLRLKKGQRSWLDGHNLSSVLALPFLLMITYSGLVFYTFEYMPSVKWINFGFDQQVNKRFEQDLYPEYRRPDISGKSAPLVDLTLLVEKAESVWGANTVVSVAVINPGDSTTRVRIERQQADLGYAGSMMLFDGVSGEPLNNLSNTSAARKFSDGMIVLHEGHFADVTLRWIYFISGLLGAAMVATGLILWTKKRRQKLSKAAIPGTGLIFIERTNIANILGLPIAIGIYFLANRLLPISIEDRAAWEMNSLFIAWLISLLHSLFRKQSRIWSEQLYCMVSIYLSIPVVNLITTDKHLIASIEAQDWILASVDVTFIFIGLLGLLIALATQKQSLQKNKIQIPASAQKPISTNG